MRCGKNLWKFWLTEGCRTARLGSCLMAQVTLLGSNSTYPTYLDTSALHQACTARGHRRRGTLVATRAGLACLPLNCSLLVQHA